MHEYDHIIKAYTGFSITKYSKLNDIPLEDVLLDVLNNYTGQSKTQFEMMMDILWQSFDNPKQLAYNSHNNLGELL